MRLSTKFSEFQKIPEWANEYLDYTYLKHLLQHTRQVLKERGLKRESDFESNDNSEAQESDPLFGATSFDPINLPSTRVVEQWTQQYLLNIDRVNTFYLSQASELDARLEQLKSAFTSQLEATHYELIESVKRQIEPRDELEHSTNWHRAFADVLTSLRRLQDFCTLNKLACQKQVLIKAVLETTQIDNDNTLQKYTQEKEFYTFTRIAELRTYLLEFYASYFTDSDQELALNTLENIGSQIRSTDQITSSFFIGMFLSLVLSVGVLLLVPGDVDYYRSERIYSIIPLFRYSLILDLSIFGIAGCIKVFQKYDINYSSMFELNPTYRITFEEFKKLAVSFLYLWLLCLFLQIVAFKYSLLPTHSSLFALVLFLIQGAFLILPLNIFNLPARYEFLYTLLRVWAAPFTEVRFKDFFLADVLCSAVKPLQDICFCLCYFGSDAWVINIEPTCSWLPFSTVLMGMLPFYWRFMQCLRKYRDTNDKFPHLVNAGKYLSSIFVALLNLIKLFTGEVPINMYITAYIVTTLYSYIWDISTDWGLLKGESKHPFLRRNLLFAPKYYYIAIVSNLFLRFAWTLTLFTDSSFNRSKLGLNVLILFLSLCEIFRRIQWSVFRLENEDMSNTERVPDIFEKRINADPNV